MSNHFRSILFAAILCVVCSVLLTAASTGLKSLQLRNMEVDRQKNILKALDLVKEGRKIDSNHIQAMYEKSVQSVWVDLQGHMQSSDEPSNGRLPLYVYVQDDRIKSYVVPVDTRGLWGKIHGYLAMENDGATIRGFTVYKHSETPGLGGEIESQWFRKNFAGKKIIDADGHFVSVGIAKGSADSQVPLQRRPNYVDGISGATMTGRFLSAGIEEILKQYEPLSVRFRQNDPQLLGTP